MQKVTKQIKENNLTMGENSSLPIPKSLLIPTPCPKLNYSQCWVVT